LHLGRCRQFSVVCRIDPSMPKETRTASRVAFAVLGSTKHDSITKAVGPVPGKLQSKGGHVGDCNETADQHESEDVIQRSVVSGGACDPCMKEVPKHNCKIRRVESEEDPDGEVLTMDEWRQLCAEVDSLDDEGVRQHETEGLSSAHDGSCGERKEADISGETSHQEPSAKRARIVHHVVQVDDAMGLSALDTEVLTAEDWKQALEEVEDENECESSSDDSDGSDEEEEDELEHLGKTVG